MYSKIIFFIATLYIVNASVITMKAHNDSPQDHAPYMMPPRCTDRICGLFCDLVGGDSGKCVDGRCRCNVKQETPAPEDTDNEIAAESVRVIEGPVQELFNENVKFDSDHTEYSLIDIINARCQQICNRVCHFLQYESGSCVNGFCKCKAASNTDIDAGDNIVYSLIAEQEDTK